MQVCDAEVGALVRVRSWDDMEDEFGLNEDGEIECNFIFVREMEEFCGQEYIIEEVHEDSGRVLLKRCVENEYEYNRTRGWSFHPDMLELVDEQCTQLQEVESGVLFAILDI